DGRGAPVDRVEAEGVHVVGEAARAADPRDHDELLARDAQIREDGLDRAQDAVVAAPGAPADFLVRDEVLLGERRRLGGIGERAHWIDSSVSSARPWISASVNGLPWTLL